MEEGLLDAVLLHAAPQGGALNAQEAGNLAAVAVEAL
jgi:hypothetical protein